MSSINCYMVDTVTFVRWDSSNIYQTETTTNITLSVKLYYQTKLLQNEKGEDVESMMKVIMKDRVINKHKDRIIVDGTTYAILKVEKPKSWVSTGHIEVWLGEGGKGTRS